MVLAKLSHGWAKTDAHKKHSKMPFTQKLNTMGMQFNRNDNLKFKTDEKQILIFSSNLNRGPYNTGSICL